MKNSNSANQCYSKANIHYENGRMELAVAAYRLIVELFPESPEASRSKEKLTEIHEKHKFRTSIGSNAGVNKNVSAKIEVTTPQLGSSALEEVLKSEGLEEYIPVFSSNHIDMELFAGLDDEDLKEIGIKSLGHRRMLLQASKSLDLDSPPCPTGSAPITSVSPPQIKNDTPPSRSKAKPIAKGVAKFGLGMLIGHLLGDFFGGDNSEEEFVGFDTDGDGIVDAVGADLDGDGVLDSFAMDTDGDGYVDSVALDTDGDGYIDTVGVDSTGDGNIDTVAVDVDGDHEIDVIALDTDGDGEIDRLV